MGRYCSCSGAAACPVTTPLEMRKNSWIPSPQMFQKLTWPKTRRHLGHVLRFVRFIPATTATISSMEPFVCKTEKNPPRCRSRTDPDVSGGRLQVAWWSRIPGHVRSKVCELHLIRRGFFEMVFFVRMPMIYWSWMIMFFFICWFLPVQQNVCHTSEFHEETYQSPRWKDGYMHGYGMYLYFSVGADKVPKICQKFAVWCFQFSDCIFHWILSQKWHFCQRFMGFSMNGKFASGAVEQDEAKNEDEWLRSILLCYFYVVVNDKQSRLLLCSILH